MTVRVYYATGHFGPVLQSLVSMSRFSQPRAYLDFRINTAGKIYPATVNANRTLTRDHTLDINDIQTILGSTARPASAKNRSRLLDMISTAVNNPVHLPHNGTCEVRSLLPSLLKKLTHAQVVHPWIDASNGFSNWGCVIVQLERFVEVFTCVV